jgi:hypothetical protein
MDEPDRTRPDQADQTSVDGPDRPEPDPSIGWVAALPPPPFVDPSSPPGAPRFTAISPRVALLVGTAILVAILLWMARDAVRPFIVGLLLVYLLDPPVRWLTRRGMRRTWRSCSCTSSRSSFLSNS